MKFNLKWPKSKAARKIEDLERRLERQEKFNSHLRHLLKFDGGPSAGIFGGYLISAGWNETHTIDLGKGVVRKLTVGEDSVRDVAPKRRAK